MANPFSLLPLQQSLQSVVNVVLGITLVIMITVVQGCGGGGSSNSSSATNNPGSSEPPPIVLGDLFIGITDAEGDFLNYEVTLQSITLVRANGDVVETLPLSTRIDFTELTEVTELLTIATVPEGVYESVVVRMDFSDAQIVVQDQNGSALMANPVDLNGDPLGVTDITLQLTTSDVIRISAGIPAAFSLDFDLSASNQIDLLTSPPTVVVEPFLLATPELETNREHRVRGVLDEVNVAAGEIALRVRPFRHRTGQFGQFLLSVNDETQYEIDGQGYTGDAGLDAMALLNVNTPVIANGAIAATGMMAHTVLAGSAVPWSDADVVVGVVSARVGEILSVKGAHVEFADGTRIFRGNFAISLSDATSVSAPGVDNADITIQSISVGQRVVAWGEFADDETLVASRVR
ncbi:MAG: DUF4382 domain-containing protein, partial [Gammaproteobacteria bacterium]|nr:DUF4382 domain-containing protein [Gammaproteobacteria bacterium]